MSEFIESIQQKISPIWCLREIDEIKSNFNKNELNEIYKRWEELGFTEEMDVEDKEDCSIAFEQMACLMLNLKYDCYDKILETIIFPIIRLVIQKIDNGKYSTKKCFDAIYEQKFSKLYDKILLYGKYDTILYIESELSSIMADVLCKVMLGEIEPKNYYSAVEKGVNEFINNLKNK